MNNRITYVLACACAIVIAARLPALAPQNAAKPGDEAIAKWKALRVGFFIHWGVATWRALPQSHSHARKSALNPSGSVPAIVYDQYYREFNPTNSQAPEPKRAKTPKWP